MIISDPTTNGIDVHTSLRMHARDVDRHMRALGTWVDWERESAAGLAELSASCADVVAVGLSMGGALVLHLAAKLPGKLRGVVVNDQHLSHGPRFRPDFRRRTRNGAKLNRDFRI